LIIDKEKIFAFAFEIAWDCKITIYACGNNSLFHYLFFSGCGKTLALGHTSE
jgi:hypothetical protein